MHALTLENAQKIHALAADLFLSVCLEGVAGCCPEGKVTELHRKQVIV